MIEAIIVGGGGYGDPLEREPERVAKDVADGLVSAEAARGAHGVVLAAGGGSGQLSDGRRARLDSRAASRMDAPSRWRPWGRDSRTAPRRVTVPRRAGRCTSPSWSVETAPSARSPAGAAAPACAPTSEDYKLGALMDQGPVTAIPGSNADPVRLPRRRRSSFAATAAPAARCCSRPRSPAPSTNLRPTCCSSRIRAKRRASGRAPASPRLSARRRSCGGRCSSRPWSRRR